MQGSIDFSGVLSGAISGEGGGGAVPVVTATATVDNNTGTPEVSVTRTGTDLNPNFNFGFKNLKGAKGDTGSAGSDGTDGVDGFSPAVSISDISGGHRVSITDATHPSGQVFDVMNGTNGADGTDGQNGTDGVSPYVTITNITDGHRVNITDATHPQGQSFDVMNGEKGDTGDTGPQGIPGQTGPGLPPGGTPGQMIYKASSTDYDTMWGNMPSYNALQITYDPTDRTYISDTDVQGALDEVDDELISVNASLTQLDSNLNNNTYSTSGLNKNQNATINVGGYVKVGKIVIVNIRVTTTASIPSGNGIVWGFPKPVNFNANYIELFNNDVMHIYMDTDGKILPGASLPAGTHIISGVYVCE